MCFLKRKRSTLARDLKPRKRRRRSAHQWLLGFNDQVLRITGRDLMHFVVPIIEGAADVLSTAPRLIIAPDQGGDGMAANIFMARRLRCSADLTPDPSHGLNNDVWLCFQETGVKSQMLFWLVCFNIPVGPWASDQRFHEVRGALADLFEHHDRLSCPLFSPMAPNMLEEAAYKDILSEADPMTELWGRLKTDSPWRTKGVKLVKSRFMAFRRKARCEVAHLTARAFGYLYSCMEMGFLGEKNITSLNFSTC